MIELPNLQDYDISPKSGFLPEDKPISRLSSATYTQWEVIMDSLPSLILTKRIRKVIENLPVLSIDEISGDKPELRRAYSILCFMAHAYVWNVDVPSDQLPKSIATPLLEVSELLEVPPVATYAGLCLWNFKDIFQLEQQLGEWDLDNLATINTFTGSIDESWFYLVSVYFEYKGASCITNGLETLKAIREDNIAKVTSNLQHLAESIDKLGSVMMKMEEMCDPHAFYYRIRPYLAGWKNMADAGLPKGLRYGDEETHRQYSGGSNAQSSLIQTLDILLNVEHFPTGVRPKSTPGANTKSISSESGQNNFMNEMKTYMPGPHQRFLTHLQQVSNIRSYVMEKNQHQLTLAYDACLAMLKSFRDKHIQIVTRYIILQAKLQKSAGSSNTLRSGLSKTAGKQEQKGTGGTSLIPFLKQCRDETGDPAAGEWGQRVLSSGVLSTKHKASGDTDKEDSNRIVKKPRIGMAGDFKEVGEEETGHW
ncbi:hypothetical protein WICPIJ_002212 [Wickerhamomyces pijperi]|uniref:Indoleamine 2,3-dioxygenase n=1 Tax=Wickerhamomyces pijperi TaxID=599730 RepID=A0A9P8QC69_WICPI|nr:hypothetical protein WICPIJ_002212 [Wickerhamomyces pijperi]